MRRQGIARGRLPLMALAGVSLIAALWAGLVRMGWQWPSSGALPAAQHGAFMVSGFLGTVISLERAVALRQNLRDSRPGTFTPRFDTRLFYLAPALAGAGSMALLLGMPPLVGRSLIVLGSAGLALLFAVIYRLQPNVANGIMAGGALAWLTGNLLWLGGAPVSRSFPWWAAFLVLTIAGERLELARVMLWGKTARRHFVAAVAVFVVGLLLSLAPLGGAAAELFHLAVRVCGVGLIMLALWLARYDVARRTVRKTGLTRFIAACLLPGYFWLGVGGLLWLWFGGAYSAGPVYDAMLHTVFLGFVFSMIFGHAPVIIPAVLRVSVPYSPLFYGHLILLHLSLLLRVTGDLTMNLTMRQWGGLLNASAVLLFLLVTAGSRLVARRTQGRPGGARAAALADDAGDDARRQVYVDLEGRNPVR